MRKKYFECEKCGRLYDRREKAKQCAEKERHVAFSHKHPVWIKGMKQEGSSEECQMLGYIDPQGMHEYADREYTGFWAVCLLRFNGTPAHIPLCFGTVPEDDISPYPFEGIPIRIPSREYGAEKK